MTQAKLNSELIATAAGEITVYNYDGETREYLSSSIEFLAVGVGLPTNSCAGAPGEQKEGFAICRNIELSSWEYIADHRSEEVYSTETGEPVIISLLGDYPENTTRLAPATLYDTWDGSKWVTDTEAQHAANVETEEQLKMTLLVEAKAIINLWQTELQLGIISDENKASLIEWLTYINQLQAVDTSTTPDINWPMAPDSK